MIDPVIFTIRLFGWFPLRWYGVIVMLGDRCRTLIIERELKRRGENGERIWDALVWVLPIGIIGARLWYVVNATIGGNSYYMENPCQHHIPPRRITYLWRLFIWRDCTPVVSAQK